MRAAIVAAFVLSVAVNPPTLAQQPGAQPPGQDLEHVIKAPEKLYDESADAKAQIAAALESAKRENRRVLIQWGGNWCPWCIRLHELYKGDQDLARELMYEYDVVYVDCGREGKNVDLAKSYGAAVDKEGFPYLTVLDADGKAIANQETASLEVKNEAGKSAGVKEGHDPAAVLEFLKKNQAPHQNASEILARGLAEAKAGGKTAFVHFGAPWCGYCHMLDRWMRTPEIAAVLGKDFVDVKIDVERTIGGAEVFTKYNANGMRSGIPWFVFLDGEGKPVADSTMEDGQNTGFPIAPAEIEHFAGMLARAGKNIGAAEQAKLIADLKERARKQ